MTDWPETDTPANALGRGLEVDDLRSNGAVVFQCEAGSRGELLDPIPASDLIPEWYQELHPQKDSFTDLWTSAKMCRPFSEAISVGWILRASDRFEFNRARGDGAVNVSGGGIESAFDLPSGGIDRSGNSTYAKPDVSIKTGWAVDVPDGYGVLITPPLNRDTRSGFEPMSSYYLPAGATEDLPFIELPGVLWEDSVTIEAGDPLATVIPIPEGGRVSSVHYAADLGEGAVSEMATRQRARLSVREDFYRQEMWVPSPDEVIGADEDSPADSVACPHSGTAGDTTDCPYLQAKQRVEESGLGKIIHRFAGGGDEKPLATDTTSYRMDTARFESTASLPVGENSMEMYEVEVSYPPEGTAEYFCEGGHFGVIPEPVPAEAFIQSWHEQFEDAFPQLTDRGYPVGDAIREAMRLGTIVRQPATVTYQYQPDGGVEMVAGGKQVARFPPNEAIGDSHPDHPFQLVVVDSLWNDRTAQGVSTLNVPPLNHFQTEYRSFSGLVETDRYTNWANAPGRLTPDGGTATFQRGMPVIQKIPFKREEALVEAKITHR